jgi:8-oxo-dGTP pyrophosphatase MutT (NUDIX family)
MPRYYVLEFQPWANVVAVTEDGRLVLVEQHRHALGRSGLEIPGGGVDPGEDAMRAAVRELAEETGFVPDDVRLIGRHAPNPALQNNWMTTFLATGCRRLQEPSPDPYEDLRVVLKSIPETYEAVLKGEVHHSIVIASLLMALPHLGFSLPLPTPVSR